MLSNENIKTGVSRKIVCFGILIHVCLEDNRNANVYGFHYWDFLTNFWCDNWQSIFEKLWKDSVNILLIAYCLNGQVCITFGVVGPHLSKNGKALWNSCPQHHTDLFHQFFHSEWLWCRVKNYLTWKRKKKVREKSKLKLKFHQQYFKKCLKTKIKSMASLRWSGTNSWKLSRLAWNVKKVNTTYMLFITSVSKKQWHICYCSNIVVSLKQTLL